MEANTSQLVNPNTADLDQLASLPGIGPELAKRIVAARPYQNAEDLQRVSGIGAKFLSRIQPFIDLTDQAAENELEARVEPAVLPAVSALETRSEQLPAQDAAAELPKRSGKALELKAAASESEREEAETEEPMSAQAIKDRTDVGDLEAEKSTEADDVDVFELKEELEAPEQPISRVASPASQPSSAESSAGAEKVTLSKVFWLSAGISFLTLLLALALSLGILAGLNEGRLQFASPLRLNQMAVQLNGIEANIDSLTRDLNSLRGRVDNLESLTGRVDALENDLAVVQSDVDAAVKEVESMNQEVELLSGQVETLTAQSLRFNSFLEGLRELMSNLFIQEEQGK